MRFPRNTIQHMSRDARLRELVRQDTKQRAVVGMDADKQDLYWSSSNDEFHGGERDTTPSLCEIFKE